MSSAEALRVSAPELSVQLARRALLVGATDPSAGTTNAVEARNLSMRAQALLAAGLVRISQHARAVEPGFAALALAEAGGAPDVAAAVRIDLAACAQQVGEPLLGGAILRPVLEAQQLPPSVRATALGRLVGCVAHVARRDDVEDALAEADRLLAADDGLSADVRRMERARLAVRNAGYHRWYGDTEDATTAAREGLNLLTRSRSDLRSESDRLRARLTLELVCGLLDEGELHEAEHAAHPIVDEPVRATSAASVGRLMLALATRVYLPSGQTDRGRHLLDQAAWMAERHALDGLRADSLTEVSRLDEQAGRAADALEALRSARAAEHRRMRAMSRAARHVLVEVGADHGIRDTTQQSVAALMRQLAHPAALPAASTQQPTPNNPVPQAPPAAAELAGTVDMEETRLLDREGLFRRLRAARKTERPVALTLVRFEATQDADRGPDTGIMAGLADKVRDMAPENAELARSDGGELAVILPAATKDQAEEFAATIRETAIESDWAGASGKDMSISTGVVHTDQSTPDDKADAAGFLTAARDAMTPAQTADTLANTSAALKSALSEETPTTPLTQTRPAESEPQGRSILSSLSIPSGSGGRRRAGEEQPPGGKSRWPAEPSEAPRWTRAERRAHQESSWPTTDPTPTPPGGWPAQTEEPSRGKRAATPDKPPFSETRTGDSTAAIDRAQLPARHDRPTEEPGQTTRRTLQTHASAEDTRVPGAHTAAAVDASAASAVGGNAPTSGTPEGFADRVLSASGSVSSEGNPAPSEPGRSAHRAPAGGGERAASSERGRSAHAASSASASGEDGIAAGETGSSAHRAFPGSAGDGIASGGSGRSARRAFAEASSVGGEDSTALSELARSALGAFSALADGENKAASGPSAPGGFPTVADAESSADGQGGTASDAPDLSARRVFSASGPDDAVGLRSFSAETTDPGFPSSASGESGFPAAAGRSGGAGIAAGGAHSSGGSSAGGDASREALPSSSGFSAGFAGLSSGGMLRGAGGETGSDRASSYEETKAELARMMSALNAKSLASREGRSNGARQSIPVPPPSEDIPEPPSRPDIPEPPEPDPAPQEPAPESGRSGLMAAFDALTGPVPGIQDVRVEIDAAAELPARRPAQSWAKLESSAVVESPADELFGTEVEKKPRFRSSLGAAFAELGDTEKKVTEPVKEPVQETTYDEPLGPPTRPAGPPRRGERSSATIASLLTEALAAYQSTAEDAESHRVPERFDSFVSDVADREQPGFQGRHRSPE